jgi:hypothetical protein
MHQFQKMQIKDFGKWGLQVLIHLDTDHAIDQTILQKLQADGIIMNRDSLGISLTMGLQVLIPCLVHLCQVILQGMVIMTPVTVLTALEI